MWLSTKLSGCLSSEQNINISGASPNNSTSASKFLAAEPSRMAIFIPCFSLSLASSAVKHSWSVEMPADMYCSACSPLRPGACPSMGLPSALAMSSFLYTVSSLNKTPGQFIISAKYLISGFFSRYSTSSGVISAPAVSNVVAGTQEGAPKLNLKLTWLPFSIIYSTPTTPRTLPISWGSDTVDTVP